MHSFGEQRLVRDDVGNLQRAAFRVLGVADPAHYLHNLYLRRALRRLTHSPKCILDAGCGAGDHTFYLARRFPDAKIVAIDIQERLIARNRRTAGRLGISNVRFEVADITSCHFDERFDLMTSIDVLEHIPEQRRAIENLAGHLAADGMAFLHVPTIRPVPVPFSSWLTDFHEWAEDEHIAEEVTVGSFVESIRAAGLTIEEARPTFSYWAGELATSLFAIPYKNSPLNRIAQLLLILPCRGLARLDPLVSRGTHFAAAVVGRRR